MEDYIYILIGVIWLAASVYKASQKNKKQAASKKPGIPQQEPRSEVSDPRSLLEELLGGQEIKIPEPEEREINIPEPENIPLERTSPSASFQSEYTHMGLKGLEALKAEGSSSFDRIIFVDEMKSLTKKGSGQSKINLRKAIIYSTILERPYS